MYFVVWCFYLVYVHVYVRGILADSGPWVAVGLRLFLGVDLCWVWRVCL